VTEAFAETLLECVARLQRQLLVHAALYYHYDESIWSDAQYDAAARRLWDLLTANPDLVTQSPFPTEFAGWGYGEFCGSLFDQCRHPWALAQARRLLPKK
jgi:NAD-dependent DNA ligase